MAERTCSVDGCERPTGVPGTARGFCSRHYHRWQKYGDPLGSHTPRMRGCICSVDGCDRPVSARGWCGTHYSRWRRHGTIEDVRAFANVPAGTKWCARCQQAKPPDEFYSSRSTADGRQAHCSECVKRRRRENRDRDYERAYADRPEVRAKQREIARRRRQADPDVMRRDNRRRKAMLRGVATEAYTSAEIAERDAWRCGICGEVILRWIRYPNPRSLSIDHVIPLARGGDDTRENVQASHLNCNVRKHARVS